MYILALMMGLLENKKTTQGKSPTHKYLQELLYLLFLFVCVSLVPKCIHSLYASISFMKDGTYRKVNFYKGIYVYFIFKYTQKIPTMLVNLC